VKKRRSSLDGAQIAFSFEPPAPARGAAELAGFDRFLSAIVGRILKEDERTREVIAAEMSSLLAETVTRMMLDAYSAEARDNHNISAHRLLALIAVTDRFDLLDTALRRIGAVIIVGEEIATAELGHIDRQMAALKARKRAVESRAKPISRRGE
jgi:hypothetical protein